jgi:ABC-type branched-subunit amino acid transport system ATPase component
MAAPLLATRGLTKRFGGLVATNDVGFSVEPGEIRGIIGPNGAGKTTLVNLITGVERPSAGEIALEGKSLLGLAPNEVALRGLVRSFQVARLFGNMSLVENLLVPHLAHTNGPGAMASGLERAHEFLALTKLTRLAGEPAKSLSGGQRVLLQVAAGFMCRNLRLYVLDEPFAGINPVIKDTILDLIGHERRQRAMTFVIVSHEMEIMRRLCDKITVMVEGRIFLEGTLDEVAANADVVAAYLGKAFA